MENGIDAIILNSGRKHGFEENQLKVKRKKKTEKSQLHVC